MIEARHIPFYTKFFSWYSASGLKKEYSSVIVDCQVDTAGRPVLLIGNHFSWWDGFISYRLNDLALHKRFHIMMLEEQLDKRLFLNKAGAFSIRKGSRSAVESLQYAASLLHNPDNMVVMYPQGEIASVHTRPVVFEKGIERIIKNAPADLLILFYVALPDWFSEKKPALTIRVKEYPFKETSIAVIQKGYNEFFQECVTKQQPS